MKENEIIINPFYCGKDVDEDSIFYMLCRIEKIFPHKKRRGGIAFRLVTIKGSNFITNASKNEVEYAQKTDSYCGLPCNVPYFD